MINIVTGNATRGLKILADLLALQPNSARVVTSAMGSRGSDRDTLILVESWPGHPGEMQSALAPYENVYVKRNRYAVHALEDLVWACENAYAGKGTEDFPNHEDISTPPSGITFGMIRAARRALDSL